MPLLKLDVLCVGHAAYDLIFSVEKHLLADEKASASKFVSCGGGPAANAAVTIARLGGKSAFAGYLGKDLYGEKHHSEFLKDNVCTDFISRGTAPTPVSSIWVKADGQRSIVNYRKDTPFIDSHGIEKYPCSPTVLLFDGHEPLISVPLALHARRYHSPTVLDAGSVHKGTLALMNQVDYLLASERFAKDYTGHSDMNEALRILSEKAPTTLITLGEKGLLWSHEGQTGSFPAYAVDAVDTTGAGDAFHGAFAYALAQKFDWNESLRYSSAVAALCCCHYGARLGMPSKTQVYEFLKDSLS